MHLLEVRDLTVQFERGGVSVKALDGVSLRVDKGSFVLVTGASGSGKTTLLSVIGAMERPGGGQAFFEGRDLSRLSDVQLASLRRRIGFVFQSRALLPRVPVWENVTYHLIPRGVGGRDRFGKATEILKQLRLDDQVWKFPEELSGGEQQRVAIARALVADPELVVADEPTSNLDEQSAREVTGLFQRLLGEGKTIVVASHNSHLYPERNQIVVLDKGKVTSVMD